MRNPIVVDTNILLSALIADSKTRELIVGIDRQLVVPEAIHREIEKYRDMIREKSSLTDEELDTLLETLFKYIQIVPDEQLEDHLTESKEELADIDEDDVIFLAAALAVDGILWSDDTDFQNQKLVSVLTTSEIIARIED